MGLAVVLATTAPIQFHQRSEQTLPLAFNQGIARVAGGWILSGTNSPFPGTDVLERVNETLDVVVAKPLPIPADLRAQGYNHVGDIDVVGNIIYAPFEQSNYDLVRQVTARYDATTLEFIDSVVLAQHENSFVTVDPATMIAYSMDHFDGNTLQRYQVNAGWKPLTPLALTMTLHHTQGADVSGGAVWITTSDPHNAVFRVDLRTGTTTSVGTLGHEGAEGEGLDATALSSGQFHALVNDVGAGTVHLGHYDLAGDAVTAPSAAGGDTAPVSAVASTGTGGGLAETGGPAWLPPVVGLLTGLALVSWFVRRRVGA